MGASDSRHAHLLNGRGYSPYGEIDRIPQFTEGFNDQAPRLPLRYQVELSHPSKHLLDRWRDLNLRMVKWISPARDAAPVPSQLAPIDPTWHQPTFWDGQMPHDDSSVHPAATQLLNWYRGGALENLQSSTSPSHFKRLAPRPRESPPQPFATSTSPINLSKTIRFPYHPTTLPQLSNRPRHPPTNPKFKPKLSQGAKFALGGINAPTKVRRPDPIRVPTPKLQQVADPTNAIQNDEPHRFHTRKAIQAPSQAKFMLMGIPNYAPSQCWNPQLRAIPMLESPTTRHPKLNSDTALNQPSEVKLSDQSPKTQPDLPTSGKVPSRSLPPKPKSNKPQGTHAHKKTPRRGGKKKVGGKSNKVVQTDKPSKKPFTRQGDGRTLSERIEFIQREPSKELVNQTVPSLVNVNKGLEAVPGEQPINKLADQPELQNTMNQTIGARSKELQIDTLQYNKIRSESVHNRGENIKLGDGSPIASQTIEPSIDKVHGQSPGLHQLDDPKAQRVVKQDTKAKLGGQPSNATQINEPNIDKVKDQTIEVEPAEPSTDIHQPDKTRSDIRQPDKTSSDIHQPDKTRSESVHNRGEVESDERLRNKLRTDDPNPNHTPNQTLKVELERPSHNLLQSNRAESGSAQTHDPNNSPVKLSSEVHQITKPTFYQISITNPQSDSDEPIRPIEVPVQPSANITFPEPKTDDSKDLNLLFNSTKGDESVQAITSTVNSTLPKIEPNHGSAGSGEGAPSQLSLPTAHEPQNPKIEANRNLHPTASDQHPLEFELPMKPNAGSSNVTGYGTVEAGVKIKPNLTEIRPTPDNPLKTISEEEGVVAGDDPSETLPVEGRGSHKVITQLHSSQVPVKGVGRRVGRDDREVGSDGDPNNTDGGERLSKLVPTTVESGNFENVTGNFKGTNDTSTGYAVQDVKEGGGDVNVNREVETNGSYVGSTAHTLRSATLTSIESGQGGNELKGELSTPPKLLRIVEGPQIYLNEEPTPIDKTRIPLQFDGGEGKLKGEGEGTLNQVELPLGFDGPTSDSVDGVRLTSDSVDGIRLTSDSVDGVRLDLNYGKVTFIQRLGDDPLRVVRSTVDPNKAGGELTVDPNKAGGELNTTDRNLPDPTSDNSSHRTNSVTPPIPSEAEPRKETSVYESETSKLNKDQGPEITPPPNAEFTFDWLIPSEEVGLGIGSDPLNPTLSPKVTGANLEPPIPKLNGIQPEGIQPEGCWFKSVDREDPKNFPSDPNHPIPAITELLKAGADCGFQNHGVTRFEDELKVTGGEESDPLHQTINLIIVPIS
ncbi:hypothetical protein L0F63_001904 [Massospora cicadina]|nr:hypothetical protein L0F63_001904 [Massospora cicadina]